MSKEQHHSHCTCGCKQNPLAKGQSRKDFLRQMGAATLGLGLAPITSFALVDDGKAAEIDKSRTIQSGKAQKITLLHTSDIHGQINVHDEFFWENGKAVFKKRGGFPHLKTMINQLRAKNPNTLLLDGGDCFQGSGIASLTEGRALVPLMNNINYDLVLPGNWEVVYGKKMLMQDLGAYNARKICANMFDDDAAGELLFPPYSVFYIGGIKIGFIGYNDPLTPIRQAPDYSKGIRFAEPEKNIARYVKILREQEQCKLVFVMSHMGLAQQLNLASQPFAEGVDYILGADTHERIREPLKGAYSKVTEPGAFASFIGKLDIVIENGVIKDEVYELMEVDPEKYTGDEEMQSLIKEIREPHQAELNRVIGKTKTTLMRSFVLETPMDNMITDALMWKFKPDVAISNGFRFCPPLHVEANQTRDITKDYLYSMIPGNNNILMADVTGQQLWDWLEKELENVFAKDPTRRLGGWLVRFQGMKIKFTIGNEMGKRLNEIKIGNKKIDLQKTYKVISCEREGDPETLLCRIKNVKNNHKLGALIHDVVEEYLAKQSPVSPQLEGRAVATDAPATLLTQVSGVNYQFR
ncbi:MAG: 5'-nucleotidase C-terminal domain-containing protein [Bacteroidia bacterium]|nr:5'-nucleotidase C-terminal domain-containing protein [Bacteroidia bacterium]